MLAGHEARSDSVPHSTDKSRSCNRPDCWWGRCNQGVASAALHGDASVIVLSCPQQLRGCQHDVRESREAAHRQVR